MALEVMTTEGDGVILLTPVYHSFSKCWKQFTEFGYIGSYQSNGIYSIDFEDLEEKFKDHANTVMIMCHPHNPIGRVWTRDELERIHALSLQYNVPVISDEIHADLTLSRTPTCELWDP
ncbi:aminotransferase class I/II-fold pyridoxal phosphate-dependent enzyme [Erysipelothrix sp. D19-032]